MFRNRLIPDACNMTVPAPPADITVRAGKQNAFEHFDRIAVVKERGARREPKHVVIALHEIETEGVRIDRRLPKSLI